MSDIDSYSITKELSYSLDNLFKGLETGEHTIEIVINDGAGEKKATCTFSKVLPPGSYLPSISGVDENLGIIEEGFTRTYQFSDKDIYTDLKVEVKLDKKLVKTFENVDRGQDYTIDCAEDISNFEDGVHKISITVYDDYGNTAVRNIAFYIQKEKENIYTGTLRKYLPSEECYRNVKLKLFNPNKTLESILNTGEENIVWDLVKTDTMNDSSKLTFKMRQGNGFVDSNSVEKLIQIVGSYDYFIIKSVVTSDNDTGTLEVSCVGEEEVLKGIMIEIIDLDVTTPPFIFQHIKDSVKSHDLPYKWKGTDAPENKNRSIEVTDECTVFEALIDMAEKFNGWLEFSTDKDGQRWVYLRTNDIDNGKYVVKGRDLQEIDITYDTNNICTRMYGFGANDPDTGNEIGIANINPTGLSYIEDYSYYLSLGMSMDEIKNNPQCLQESIYRDSQLIDDIDIYRATREELDKYCVPRLTGNISMMDLSIRDGSSMSEPQVGEKIVVVDKDINFSMSCRIKSIERKFTENPYDISIEIDNLVEYNSVLKDLVHTSETVDRVVENDGIAPYVPVENVKDENGLHLNFKLDNLESDLYMDYGRLESNFDDFQNRTHSQFLQTAEQISTRVTKDEFGTQMIQNAESWKYIFNHVSSYIEFDETGIWCRDTAFGSGYTCMSSQGLVHMDNKDDPLGKPYHYLTWSSWFQMRCSGNDYTTRYIPLPERFLNIRPEDISVNVAIKKMYDSNKGRRCACYWFGAFGSIENNQIRIDAMSTWRDWDDGGALLTDGIVDVTVILIA